MGESPPETGLGLAQVEAPRSLQTEARSTRQEAWLCPQGCPFQTPAPPFTGT